MNNVFLLEAIGLIDDELIADAEQYTAKKIIPLTRLLSWAACLAVVIVLGYGVTHLRMGSMAGGGNSAAPAASTPAASAPAASTPAASTPAPSTPAAGAPSAESPAAPAASTPSGGSAPMEGIAGGGRPAIMVDGVVYWSTGNPIPVEPDPSVIRTSDSYTDGLPEKDGQNNFSSESVEYAKIDMGVVVLVDHEWVLFTAEPPEN